MTSAVDLIRGTTPSTRAGAGRAAGWRCPPEGERQRHPEKADGREGHCTWPDHCSRPSQPLAQSLRSASAPEGPERSGGGAERLAAVRIARTTLPGDGLGPARPGPNLPPPRLVEKHLWEVGESGCTSRLPSSRLCHRTPLPPPPTAPLSSQSQPLQKGRESNPARPVPVVSRIVVHRPPRRLRTRDALIAERPFVPRIGGKASPAGNAGLQTGTRGAPHRARRDADPRG